MTWIIGDNDTSAPENQGGVELSFGGPQRIDRRILRKQTADKILEDYPLPFDLGPDSFELQLSGLIYPPAAADRLYEMAKRAESDTIIITNDDPNFQKLNGQYAVTRGSISISSPQFDTETGALVQRYDITFIQFAEQSDTGNGDSGDEVGDDDGIGFGDFDFGFGDLIKESFQNLFPNLFA